jgi:hypothetical protein
MKEGYELQINNSSDAIVARAKIRQSAREKGLDVTEQARISLAMYSLTGVLRIGNENPGQILVHLLKQDKRDGLSVACVTSDTSEINPVPEMFSAIKWMVDEMTIEVLPSNAVKVTLIQWITSAESDPAKGRQRPFKVI